MRRKHWALLAAIGLALTGAGCDDTLRGVEKDTKENTAAAKQTAKDLGLDEAAKKAAEKAAEAAEAARRGAENIARDVRKADDEPQPVKKAEPYRDGEVSDRAGKALAKVEEAGREIASEAKAAGIHADVKAALMRDKGVDASHINVDVDDDQRLLLLKGTVPNAAQKARAEEIARQRAGGYAFRSELSVAVR
jgi:osmotically-inducible protein OsmY